jgi:enolase-phosphatase E1
MIRAILTDIEGTTSSLSFVKDVLFPYARERLAAFVAARADDPEVSRQLDEVRRLAGAALTTDEAVAELIRWIDEDRKATPLKTLQGMIWEEGYRGGDFHGHVYEDAVRKLREWKAAGLALFVFSSGSVQAQKLLFAHTGFGDLTSLFSGYFDTRIGAKQEPDSYRHIVAEIGEPAERVLFLSDIEAELDAASEAGLQVRWLIRPPAMIPTGSHACARNFDEIVISN